MNPLCLVTGREFRNSFTQHRKFGFEGEGILDSDSDREVRLLVLVLVTGSHYILVR